MSILEIVADLLDVDKDRTIKLRHAESLLEIMRLKLDSTWDQEQIWEQKKPDGKTVTHKMKLEDIKTTEEFFAFLQLVGQRDLFGSHDRTKFKDGSEKKEHGFYNLFEQMGLTQEVSYSPTLKKPDRFIVHGGLASRVEKRLETLKQHVKKGVIPSDRLVIGLGASTRKLRTAKDYPNEENEQSIIDKMQEAKSQEPLNEMGMVNFMTQEALKELNTENPDNYLAYEGMPSASTATDLADPARVKTSDTGETLRKKLEKEDELKGEQKEVLFLGFSDQPFNSRMELVFNNKLGKQGHLINVCGGLTKDEYDQHPGAMSNCFGEIARYIDTRYTSKERKLDRALTKEERTELLSFGKPKFHPEKPKIAGSPHSFHTTTVIKKEESPSMKETVRFSS